jgi:glycosyltransferase involved in cell wall biosynthesis
MQRTLAIGREGGSAGSTTNDDDVAASSPDDRWRVLSLFSRIAHTTGPLERAIRLDDDTFRVTICSLHDTIDDLQSVLGRFATDKAVRALGVPQSRPAVITPTAWWRVYGVMRAVRPHVLHVHHSGSAALGMLLARATGVPAIVHFEGTLRSRYSRLRRLGKAAVTGMAHANICVSQAVLDDWTPLETWLARHAVPVVIHNGVAIDELDAEAGRSAQSRRELGIAHDARIIACVGRLIGVKDHRTAIRAMSVVKRYWPSAQLVVAGDGPLRGKLERYTESLNLSSTVRFVGLIERPQVYRLLHAADAFLLPSRVEGLSAALVQAMAAGCAIVATDISPNRAVVEHGVHGVLVPPGDSDAMSAGLDRFLRDPAFGRKLGLEARRYVVEELPIAKIVRQYEALYERLLI